MLSHHRFIAFIGALLIPALVAAFVLYSRSKACVHTDKAFCDFLSKLEMSSFEDTHGSFISQNGEKASKVSWILEGHNKQIKVSTDDTEAMNLIATKDTVYVKDYRDNLWWEQPRKEMEKYVFELAFDPEVFLNLFIERVGSPNIKIGKKTEFTCGTDSCVEYEVSDNDFKTVELIGIQPETGRLVRYAGKKDDATVAFNIIYEPENIALPTQTKKAEAGQNILLDQLMYTPSGKKTTDLDYVREFEEQMKQNK